MIKYLINERENIEKIDLENESNIENLLLAIEENAHNNIENLLLAV